MRAMLIMILALSCTSYATTAAARSAEFTRITKMLTDVQPPPQSDSEWIARSMRMNGLPMTLKSFRSRLSPDAVCKYYESLASRHLKETSRVRNGDWLTLSMRSRTELTTIQLRATISGSEGTITVTPTLESAQLQVETTFPRPPTTRIVTLQEYDDDGIEAEHISLTSVRSVAMEAQAFTQQMKRDDWQIVRDQPMQSVPGGRTVEAQKGAQHALLTLMRNTEQSGTAIVVVWRKA